MGFFRIAKTFEVDLERQVVNGVSRYELFRNGILEQTLLDEFPLRWYWKDEIVRLLHEAGFSRVEFLTDAPEYKEGSVFWVQARV